MASIRNRLIFILLLVTLALVGLWPRQVVVGPAANGTDSTETQWGLKLGLDLQGGMHLAVEIDQSGGPVTNPEDALDRAERHEQGAVAAETGDFADHRRIVPRHHQAALADAEMALQTGAFDQQAEHRRDPPIEMIGGRLFDLLERLYESLVQRHE